MYYYIDISLGGIKFLFTFLSEHVNTSGPNTPSLSHASPTWKIKMERKNNGLPSDHVTLPELIYHMRHGQTVLGTSVKPYPWLQYTTRSKTDMELKVEAALTSCSFKTVTSCVIGEKEKN